jgi:toxin FitB
MYLLDTNVISELCKHTKGTADTQVSQWFSAAASHTLYTSVICLLKLERGALSVAGRDALQGQILLDWINNQVRPSFAGRVLAIDEKVASICAAMHVPNPRSEADALIATTAMAHGLAVVTRNVKDFAPMGVRTVNPWGDAA